MGLEEDVSAATPESKNSISAEYLGIVVASAKPENPIISTAWTFLEAANDLGDIPMVEACRRVIDADLSGALPKQNDINIMFDLFN